VDEEGNRLFTVDDVAALKKKSGLATVKVFRVAKKLNGLGADDSEEMEKN
jgi:hypothetical protein